MFSSAELLKKLKEQHDKRTVSVLVGAGFSKNAISTYPAWDELLKDLVMDLYGQQIKESYRQYKSSNEPRFYTEDEFTERAISSKIREFGYLNLVSNYIQFKGYREAIDVYIEDHMPFVEELNGTFKVVNRSNLRFTISNLDVHKELLLCKWKHIYTTNYDNLLELTSTIYGMDYFKIVKDFQLAQLSEHRGIVKIHGSLVGDSLSNDYEFDNDKSRRYIISAEDYATYGDKHQAFSYQMKTGLLTGEFCLIGFSGNDPNFLGWLEWMKDVLDKDLTIKSSIDSTKVFLLTIGDSTIERSRQLFYQNHHIGLINILDVDVLKMIGAPPHTSDVGTIFTLLFRYLNDGTAYVVKPIGNTIVNTLTKYKEIWSVIDTNNVSNEDVSEIRRLRKNIVLPPNSSRQRDIISSLYKKKEWSQLDAELFALACQDCGSWFYVYGDDVKGKLLKDVKEWQQLQQMAAIFRNDDVDFDNIEDVNWRTYLKLLQLSYRLESKSMIQILNAWDADGYWVLNKAALYSNIDSVQCLSLIDSYLNTSSDIERRYYASVLGNMVTKQWPAKYSYNEFKIADISGFIECRDSMLKNIKYEKKEVKPYGNSGWSFVLGKRETDVEEALRFVQLLFNVGFPLQLDGYSLISHQDWYEVFKRIYGYMPYVALYYSLQLTDKNTLIRIGQDFAFAKEFADITPSMLSHLLCMAADASSFIKREPCLWVAKELICTVNEEEWFDDMVFLFHNTIVPISARLSSFSAFYQFLIDVAYHLKDTQKKSDFFDMVLEHFDDNTYFYSDIIYRLHLNNNFSLSRVQRQKVKEIVATHSLDKIFLIAAHLGHCGLLDDSIKRELSDRIKKLPDEVAKASFEVLHSLTFITFGDEEAIMNVKNSILNKNIWQCGISGKSATPPYYLALNKISRDIIWTKDEMRRIMENLEQNLSLLEGWNCPDDGFFANEHLCLLSDMMEFTEQNCISLTGLIEFNTDLERIKQVIYKSYGSTDILEKLFDNDTVVDHELKYLARCIDFYGIDKYRVFVDLIFDRALLQCEKSLTMVLLIIENLVVNHIDAFKDEKSVYKLRMLLERYVDVDYKKINLNLSVAYRSLHNVAKVLMTNKMVNDYLINYWLEDDWVKRFSN